MFQTTQELKIASNTVKAMGNFYRLQIILLLLSGEKNVSTINKDVKVSQPALSQHLSKLRKTGIVGSRREQRQIFYFIINPHVTRIIGVLADMQTKKEAA